MFRVCAASLLIIGLLGPSLGAHVTVPADFRDIVTGAELIVRGRITDVRAARGPAEGMDSVATVLVEETLKGESAAFVAVRVPGGVVGNTRVVMVGAPRLAVNQAAVFFLRRSPDNSWRPIGLGEGIVRIRLDRATGRPLVQSPVSASRTAGRGRTDAPRPMVTVQEFDAMVRLVVEGQTRAVARPAR